MTQGRRERAAIVALVMTAMIASPRAAAATGPASPPQVESAAVHFRHGVELYKDADYAGALAEFRRAQELSPNYRVLYDIGQSLYELQRYAEALKAFEDYLGQGGSQLSAARRATVEGDLRSLRDRVGYADVTVDTDGAEVRIDDQSVGTSPFRGPILVSVGHRKITVTKAGYDTVERFTDVTSGDHARIAIHLPSRDLAPATPLESPHEAAATGAAPVAPASPPSESAPSAEARPPISRAWIPWTITGVLAIGTVVTGGLTLSAKGALSNDLSTFPGDPSAIDHDRSRARAFALASDVLLGATALSFGVALFVTLRPHKAGTEAAGVGAAIRVGVDGLRLQGDF